MGLLTLISLLAQSLVGAGAIILVVALLPFRRLIRQLPLGAVRNRWSAMTGLILLFLVGYVGYAAVAWDRHLHLFDLIVPAVFFAGACFVWLTATLSLQTTLDIMRISTLEHETVTDALTGIFNRRYLDRRLSEEVARAGRHHLPLSILLVDIDHFKHVNDGFGHQAGDQVLVALAEIFAQDLREADVVARYGGEEFLVIAPHTPLAAAILVAERLRTRIEAHQFCSHTEMGEVGKIDVTASIGVASLSEDANTKEKLIQIADASLYRAKQEGRNRVRANLPSAPILLET